MKKLKVWIGRTEAIIPDEDVHMCERNPSARRLYTKLQLLYDRPTDYRRGEWKGSRVMAEIPNYMFPEIEEEEYAEFIAAKILDRKGSPILVEDIKNREHS